MRRWLSSTARKVPGRFSGKSGKLVAELDHLRFAIGAHEARHARAAAHMREAEFRAFSQFGEDGIIQWLIARVPIERTVFVEFGVGDYRESNTRFLLEHDNWKGLVLDSGDAHIRYLQSSGLGWRHSITGRSAFITREGINDLLRDVEGDVGLLSVDLDGVDYWVLEALQVVEPRIVVVEYNSLWGPSHAVSIPYEAGFNRAAAHWSWLYFGASLAAFCNLMSRRGYRFVGSNSTGQNAFFVREDVAGDLPSLTAAEGWVRSRFRDSRDANANLSYLDNHQDRLATMADMPLVDVVSGEGLRVADLSRT